MRVHAVLLAAVNHATSIGFDAYTGHLAWTLIPYLDMQGYWHELADTARAAVTAAERLPDLPAHARAHRDLAHAYTRLGRFDEAHIQIRHALDLFGRAGDRIAQAHTQYGLAHLWEQQGRHAEALVGIQ